MDEADQLLELVDTNNNPVSTTCCSQKSQKLKKHHEFLRAAEVLILNKNGEL